MPETARIGLLASQRYSDNEQESEIEALQVAKLSRL
jgi:hypothetical protein